MKKKVAPKKVIRSRKKSEKYKIVGFTIITIGCILFFFDGLITYNFATQSTVLGASTYIAQGGDDSGSPEGSGGSDGSGDSGPGNPSPAFVEPKGILGGEPKPTFAQGEVEHHRPPLFISGKPGNPHFRFERSEDGSDSSSFKNIGGIKHGHNGMGGEDLLIQQSTNSGKFRIKTGSTEAETHFPLSINTATNQLIVTTPSGSKVVTVLPDQAVANLLQKGIISDVNQSSSSSQINLTENNNEPVFSIQGVSKKKFLGLIPDSIQKTVNVSAQTGQVVSVKESILQKLLDIFSF